MQSTTIGS